MTVRVDIDDTAVRALAASPLVRAAIRPVAVQLAAVMRDLAPKRTGGGAASIHEEPNPDGPGWRVGWSQERSYLRYPNTGTRYVPAEHFAERAAARFGGR